MSDNTNIEWATHTFNPWEGCTKISPGCAHCYAEARNHRFGMDNWGKGKPRRRTSKASWAKPLRWDRGAEKHNEGLLEMDQIRPRIFPSLCDWLDDEVPIEWLGDLMNQIWKCPNLDFLLLTKRPELFFHRLNRIECGWKRQGHEYPPNVWVGVSIENQEYADKRIPELLKIPAKIRFLSVEPLLSSVDLWGARYEKPNGGKSGAISVWKPSVDWVIVGGESGKGARPCNVEWIQKIVKDCKAAGVPCFVKQLGSFPTTDEATPDGWPPGTCIVTNPSCVDWGLVELKHPKGGDPAEWSEDLRVREFPI